MHLQVVKDIAIRYSSSFNFVCDTRRRFFFSLQNQGEEEKLNEWNTSPLRQIKETRNSLDINIFWSFFSNKRWIEKKINFFLFSFLGDCLEVFGFYFRNVFHD